MRKVLLYSTGLDSELHRMLLNPDVLLFFRSGASYQSHEEKQLKKLCDRKIVDKRKVIIDDTLNFESMERKDHIVPMRNIFYALRGLGYGERVYLGTNAFDIYYDQKDFTAWGLTTFVRSYYHTAEKPESWDTKDCTVETPYANLTKAELLNVAISEGHDVSHISTLRTCYDKDSEKGCGCCPACMHKAIALANNGLFRPSLFDTDPRIGAKKQMEFYAEALGERFVNELNILMQ